MLSARTPLRALAPLASLALLAGPLAAGAQAASKKTPTPVISSKPADPTNATSATFAFSDILAGATYSCSLDFGTYASCTSPKTYTALKAGSHNFRVRASAPTRTPSSSAQATWTVDLTAPPKPTLSGLPSGTTKTTSVSPTFSDTESTATFRCSLDGATPVSCTSPRSITGLADGTHTFAVTARDAAGNSSAAATGTWTVDTQPPPVPSVTTGPADPTNSTSATFQVYDTDATATLTCRVDSGAYATCGPTASYATLTEGAHTFDVKASDAVGNAVNATQYAWTVDLTAPTPPTILTGPAASTNATTAHFTFDPHDATQLRCALDSTTDYADCGSTYDTATLADGSHTLRVLGRDIATNESGATPYTWTVDTVAPAAPTVAGPAARTSSTSASFTLTDADATATFTCALDGGAAAACTSPYSVSGPLADGAHTLAVTATDPAGNTASTPYSWTVDTVQPIVGVTTPATITAPVAALFNESVKGVSGSSFVLRLTNSTTARSATLSCRDGSNAVVPCATGPVRVVSLRPVSVLVPGEKYTVVANPTGAAGITDLAGNPLAMKSVAFRAATTVQENSVAAHYTWRSVSNAAVYGGAYRTEHLAGATVGYGFTGTSVTWYTVKGPTQGSAYVYVDGVKKATVNNYAAATSYNVARTVTGLTNASHSLRIVVAGTRAVSVDAVKVGTTLTTNPTLLNLWRYAATSAASGGFLAAADLANETVSLTFRGTSISWYTSTGRNRGKAQLYVDGVLKATYDNYASATAYNVRRYVGSLTDAVHTVKVVVLGTHRAGATGTLVCVDRFVVG